MTPPSAPTRRSLTSLNGKVLRVNPDLTNTAWPGNPYQVFGSQSLVYNYGHRNVQGLAFRADGNVWTAEHGTDRDDEVNVVVAGGVCGWDPIPGYNERADDRSGQVPRRHLGQLVLRLPDGGPSGMTFLRGPKWGPWSGALALATLKNSRLRIQFTAGPRSPVNRSRPSSTRRFGRLRTAQEGPDGCFYVLTGNGGTDQIIRACPS